MKPTHFTKAEEPPTLTNLVTRGIAMGG